MLGLLKVIMLKLYTTGWDESKKSTLRECSEQARDSYHNRYG